jgi:hypothetical protein
MNIWYRSAGLAGAILLWANIHVGAQIRETAGLPPKPGTTSRPRERGNHPVVLLHTRAGEFEGGERIVTYLMLQRLDPASAVERASPPSGVDGLIAYPGSRMLAIRGTKEAVAGYRATLEKLDHSPAATDRQATAGGAGESRPSLIIPEGAKLGLEADRVETEGDVTRATGHVFIRLGSGVELHAAQVRLTKRNAGQEMVIER